MEKMTEVDAAVHVSAEIMEHALIGRRATIGAHARVGKGAVIGANARIEDEAVVEWNAVIGDGATIGAGAHVGARARVPEGAVIAPREFVIGGATVPRIFCDDGSVVYLAGWRKVAIAGRVYGVDDPLPSEVTRDARGAVMKLKYWDGRVYLSPWRDEISRAVETALRMGLEVYEEYGGLSPYLLGAVIAASESYRPADTVAIAGLDGHPDALRDAAALLARDHIGGDFTMWIWWWRDWAIVHNGMQPAGSVPLGIVRKECAEAIRAQDVRITPL